MGWHEVYSEEQRDALATAYVDWRVAAPRVVALAAAGELATSPGNSRR